MKGDRGMKKSLGKAAIGYLYVFAFSLLAGLVGLSYAANKPECIKDSDKKTGFIITSAPCGIYGTVPTRDDITVQCMVHKPEGLQKGLVVLFAGGNGDTGIAGDPATGKVTAAGNNFLVRSAQLFAKQHYLAVTIDRPLVGTNLTPEFETPVQYDRYRVSTDHGADIKAVVSEVNKENLPVFLAGISRGALSAVAQNRLPIGIVGILLSSPTTSDPYLEFNNLYIGHPDYENLQPTFVDVPLHVLAHALDGCEESSPEDSEALHNDFVIAGVNSRFDELTGGFKLIEDPCLAKTYHGFLGIENEAVKKITDRMDQILKATRKK
jgi:hypothetical protein